MHSVDTKKHVCICKIHKRYLQETLKILARYIEDTFRYTYIYRVFHSHSTLLAYSRYLNKQRYRYIGYTAVVASTRYFRLHSTEIHLQRVKLSWLDRYLTLIGRNSTRYNAIFSHFWYLVDTLALGGRIYSNCT